MTTVKAFIAANRIWMKCDWLDRNPNMPDFEGTHFMCRLQRGRKRMQVTFSQGFVHTGEPQLASVLDCLASDASGYENSRDFDDWASEYGYATDSRRAERTFNAVRAQSSRLKAFLGQELYDELLWKTERE